MIQLVKRVKTLNKITEKNTVSHKQANNIKNEHTSLRMSQSLKICSMGL